MVTIPITKPLFGPEELRAVQLPLESGWIVQGPFVRQFEKEFSAFTGSRFSCATTSCTAGLHLAVAALGLKPGDEVIVPGFTWISTPNVVEYMGATPVFCDIQLDTFNIDIHQIEALITPRTVGMIPVHLFGLCADMSPMLEIARKKDLWVVEDAACGFGAWYRGRQAGTFGEMGCFSFHPRKTITTGEGGMITTDREDLLKLVRSLRDHGSSRTDLERHQSEGAFLLAEYEHLGYNYRMTDIQGALGCAQMKRAKWILTERSRCAGLYDEMLSELEWLTIPVAPDGDVHGYQAYVCLYNPAKPTLRNVERLNSQRNELMSEMERRGIATRVGTHAPITLPYYTNKYNLKPSQFPNSYMADRLSITLPLYAEMTEAEQDLVVTALKQAAGDL